METFPFLINKFTITTIDGKVIKDFFPLINRLVGHWVVPHDDIHRRRWIE